MKKVFLRILGGLLAAAGGFWAFCTVISFLGMIWQTGVAARAIGWLFWLLVGIGVCFLGIWILKRPGKQPHEKQKPASPAKLPSSWKQPVPLSKLARKDPWEAQVLAWEEVLTGAVSRRFMRKGRSYEKVDKTFDNTHADWFIIGRGGDLQKILEIYAQMDSYLQSCKAKGVPSVSTENSYWLYLRGEEHFFILAAEEQFRALGEDTESCLALCREHHFHLVRDNLDHTYYDYVSGNTYETYLERMFSKVHNDEDDPDYGTISSKGAISLRVVKGEPNE